MPGWLLKKIEPFMRGDRRTYVVLGIFYVEMSGITVYIRGWRYRHILILSDFEFDYDREPVDEDMTRLGWYVHEE